MLSQAVWSVIAGLALSGVAFVPVLVWQYRRYGAPSPMRLFGLVMAAVYGSAIIAYTLFPLPGPGELTPGFCTARGRPLELDPTAYFRAMPRELAGLSPIAMAKSWVVMQMVLNVALFVPLGVLGRRLGHWSAGRTVLTGAGVSLLVEATQYTGNWGLMACSYRFADVNDLITNTTGTAIGVAVAGFVPRLFADPDALVRQRESARPVTRVRRWTAMLLDAWILACAVALTWVGVFIAFGLAVGPRLEERGMSDLALELMRWAAVAVTVALAVLPTLRGSRASLGQRIVYLRPVPVRRDRPFPLVTPGLLRGVAVVGIFAGPFPVAALAVLWLVADVLWVLRDPRGLSGVVSGHDVADARAVDRAGSHAGSGATVREPVG